MYAPLCKHILRQNETKAKIPKLIVLDGEFYQDFRKTSGLKVLSQCRDENTSQACFQTSHGLKHENQIRMAKCDMQSVQSEGQMFK
jgi:hypothetical protein